MPQQQTHLWDVPFGVLRSEGPLRLVGSFYLFTVQNLNKSITAQINNLRDYKTNNLKTQV